MVIDPQMRCEIADRIHAFFDCVDKGSASKTIDFFAPDAAVTYGPGSPRPGTLEGENLRQAMIAREGEGDVVSRHSVSNFVFEETGDSIGAAFLLTLYRSYEEVRCEPDPVFVADIKDRWSLVDGVWLMRSREILPVFSRS